MSAIIKDSDRIRELVEKYCAEERHPSLPRFAVHGPFMAGNDVYALDATRKAGCYVFYGSDGSYHYIGMSLTNVGNRIASHLSPGVQAAPFWRNGKPPYSIGIIEVNEPWEAPSLEAYLYAKMSGTAQVKS